MLLDFILSLFEKILSLFDRPKTYVLPDMEVYQAYRRIWNESGHIVIAGSTGSGKSVLIRELIRYGLHGCPSDEQFIFCDPKRVDLFQYANLPHTISYNNTPEKIEGALSFAVWRMQSRYKDMKRNGQTKSDAPRINIIIDSLADLLTEQKESKQIKNEIIELCRLGRPANIRLIMATQAPSRKALSAEIVQNCDRIALRCFSPIESRQILGQTGAESLPAFGVCLWRVGSSVYRCEIPMMPEEEHRRVIKWWNAQQNGASKEMIEESRRRREAEQEEPTNEAK